MTLDIFAPNTQFNMKKLYSFVFLFFLSLAVMADEVTTTYYFSHPEIISHNGYQFISFENTKQLGQQGCPTLPYLPLKLLLPPGQTVQSVEIIRQELTPVEGQFELFPHQPSRPLSENKKLVFQKNDQVYQSTDVYPANAGNDPQTQYLNGYGFAIGALTPVSYIPATGQLGYYARITVVVHTMNDQRSAKALELLTGSDRFQSKARLMADNPEAIESYTAQERVAENYPLLIITPEQFSSGFDQLRTVYLERGLKSEVATVEFIVQNGTGNDVQEKIRNYILDQYQNKGVEFVILGGDTEFVPHRGFYCYVQSGGGYSDSGIPADLYYAALDGTWNDNQNNLWGEPDEDDLLPEIAVGRFPFSTPDELENMVHKSIYYQNFPVTGELTHALMAGEHLYSDPETWGSDYLELLIGTHNDNGYTTVGIPEDYNFEKLYEVNQSWSKYDLMNAINSGKQMVHHVGHAAQTYVAYMTNSDITNVNFQGANGIDHNYTLLQTHGCDCGAFDVNDCILEKMVTIDNFAVAVLGNSRFGWFNEGQTEGPAAHLHREMMDALYGEEMRFLGQAYSESKIQTAPWVEATGQWEEGALRWNFYDLNLLGDPALSVWTNEPVAIEVDYEEELVLSTASTVVTVTSSGLPAAGFTCTLMKEGVLLGTSTTDAYGTATIVIEESVTEPGMASLVVNGRNCLPASFDVQFIPDNGAFVVFSSVVINDETGNNNQMADYGETITLTVTVGNVGLSSCEDLMVTLSTEDGFVNITDDIASFGDIPAGGLVTIENAFTVEVRDSIPDLHLTNFMLHCQSDTVVWQSAFGIDLHAPVLQTGELQVLDTQGNHNNSLDPGETDTLSIAGLNTGHSAAFSTQISLSTVNPFVTLNTGVFTLGELQSQANKPAFFEIVVSQNAPIGEVIELNCEMTDGIYLYETTYYLAVGLVVEDFETGDFSRFEWQQGGNLPWTITNNAPFEGTFSARSGEIDDYQKSELLIELEVFTNDEVSFYRKVSSEEDYDYLRFYIDGAKLGEWAGLFNWQQETYTLNAGVHVLKWAYEKDINSIGGEDAAWLDNIVFPANATILSVHNTGIQEDVLIFPNPAHGEVTILADTETIEEVAFISLTGKKITALQTLTEANKVRFDLTNMNSGVYFIEIRTSAEVVYKKLIIN